MRASKQKLRKNVKTGARPNEMGKNGAKIIRKTLRN